MPIRDLLSFNRSIPVTRGPNPIIGFQDEMNKLFADFFGDLSFPSWDRTAMPQEASFMVIPAIDVRESDKEIKITAELPGMELEDLHITSSESFITLRGEKKQEETKEQTGYFRQERCYGSFQRVIALPATANCDKADASFKNGVLTLSIPKKEGAHSKERTIQIKKAA